MSVKQARVFHPNWEDLQANSRLQLFQMLKELEVPAFPTATTNELITIIESYLHPDDTKKRKEVIEIYTKNRNQNRRKRPHRIIRTIAIIIASVLFISAIRYIGRPKPYCVKQNQVKCRPCPDLATCSKRKAKCPGKTVLTKVGCRPKSQKKSYKAAAHASRFIAERQGDCIQPLDPLTVENFQKIFKSVDISIFSKEPGFNIEIVNDTLVSNSPLIPKICVIMNSMESYADFIGPVVIALISLFAFWLVKQNKNHNYEIAKDLADQAHKILATSDKQIYMYDMKVQLRARYTNIDKVWKLVVKLIEDDSHVIVGVVGARHEVYWKWVQSTAE